MSKRAVFITGTGTGIGKTVACAWLALHWKADYWKPIQSGLTDGTDTQQIQSLTKQHCHDEAYRLNSPLSPHESARIDGIDIQLAKFNAPDAPRLVIEGAGGLMVPLNEREHMGHLIQHLNVPVILTASSGLGTINHTWLTSFAMKSLNLRCLGVIMIGQPNCANREAIERYTGLRVLAELPVFSPLNQNNLLKHPLPESLRDLLSSEFTLR